MRTDSLTVSITSADWGALHAVLFTPDGNENFAVLFCGAATGDGWQRLLVREWWAAPRSAYYTRESYHLEITPNYLNKIVDHSLKTQQSPIIIHSHPGVAEARYSASDDYGEKRLLPVLSQLLPGLHPASLLAAEHDLIGRTLVDGGFQQVTRVSVLGRAVRWHEKAAPRTAVGPETDRQVRAWGTAAQITLQRLKIGIVGVGGTGSPVAEQLIRLGVADLLLMDPDDVEESNLSRMWGTVGADVGMPKADVVARHLRGIAPKAVIRAERQTVVRQCNLCLLRDRDLIFACTDNHWSRAVLNRFAHQYLIPMIDMGTRLDARQGSVTAAAGRVSIVGQGLSCLVCSGVVDPGQVRAESLAPEERAQLAREGYVAGAADPAPAVITINTTVAALAVTTGLSLFINLAGAPPSTSLRYDAKTGSIFTTSERHDPRCEHCSPFGGVKGLGDAQVVSAYD